MRRGAFIICLNELYYYRPSMVTTRDGVSILDLLVFDPEFTKHNVDWVDGMIMGFILNHNWNNVYPDYPVHIELLDHIYQDDDGFGEVLNFLTEEYRTAIDVYISTLLDKKAEIESRYSELNSMFTIVNRVSKINFDTDCSNLKEVVVYER